MVKALYPGVWDLLHPGMLFALDWASKRSDHLTAAISIDPTIDYPEADVPIESDLDRFVRLLCCKFVDSVVYYEGEQELETLYRSGYYDVTFISVEYEKSYTPTHGVKPIFVPRLSEHSIAKIKRSLEANGDFKKPETLLRS